MRRFALLLALVAVATAPRASSAEPTDVAGTPWTIGVAPRLGVTVPTSKLGPMLVGGIEIDWAPPVLGRRLVAALDVSLTRPGHGGSTTDPRTGEANYDIDETELKLALLGVYRVFGPERRMIPYGGLGPVLHLLETAETTDLAPGENTSQDTNLGFELLGGVDYRLGPGYLSGELRVVYSNLDHLLTGNSNAGNVMLSAGYRLTF
jgi:opacity protein-like surface antigen